MKQSISIVTAVYIVFSSFLFLLAGCEKKPQLAYDWYSEVPKSVHEMRFPLGHDPSKNPNDRHCSFNTATNAYFCQFNWDEYKNVSEDVHMKRFPHGHDPKKNPNDSHCYFNKSTNAYFCQFDWAEGPSSK